MANENIIIIDSVGELYDKDGETVIGRLITDKAGNDWKVKRGQGGKITEDDWAILDEAPTGTAVKLIMAKYKAPDGKTYPFVGNFELVKDALVKEAAEKAQTQQADNRERSYALSYSKDLAVSDKISVEDILPKAQEFFEWLTNVKLPTGMKPPSPSKEEEDNGGESPNATWCPQDIKELMQWAMSHGKQYTPSLVCQKLDVKAPTLIRDIAKAHQTLKEKMGWED